MARKTNTTVNGQPAYRVRHRIGTTLEGKPVYKNFYGAGKLEAEAKRDAYIEKTKHSRDPNVTLGALAQKYTYQILPTCDLAQSTITLYEAQYRKHLQDSPLSIKAIGDITRDQVVDFMGGEFGNRQAMVKYMRKLFRWLSNEGYCPYLMEGIQIGRTNAIDDITTLTEDEVRAIKRTPNRLHFLFILAIGAGLRLGELLGLTWDDFHDQTVRVTKQLSEFYEPLSSDSRIFHIELKETKTRTSIRTVPLPDSLWEEFLKYKKTHEKNSKFLFVTKTGHFISRGNFQRAWERQLKRAGVPYKNFHSCRATYCTLLCRAGVPLETASKLMGHSDVSVTARYYRMIADDELARAVNKIDYVLSDDTVSNDTVS